MKLSIEKQTLGTIPIIEVVEETKKEEIMPLIVYYHGWRSTKELNLTQGRYLALAGFRVILPDADNHGARNQPVSKIPSLTFWQSIHSNLFEFGYIINEYKKRGVIDDRIGVGGVSMGGITTSALLTHHPEIKVAACLMGSPKLTAYRERINKHADQLDVYFPADYNDLLEWIPKYDLSLHPEKINGRPLLFWHGTRDTVVPYSHVVEFIEENEEKENIYFVDEDEAHLVKPKTMAMITEFFAEHLI